MQRQNQIHAGKSILVASTGGHLEQLNRFVRNGQVVTATRHWITFDHQQARSLLENEEKTFIPYIPSRGMIRSILALPKLYNIVRSIRPDTIVSTGAAIAVPTAVIAGILRRRMVYIESVSRFDSPSLSGRILSKMAWVKLYTQHERWADEKWKLGPTVLGSYIRRDRVTNGSQKNVFVSLGTIKPYRFDRAVSALTAILDDSYDVRIQYGATVGDYQPWQAFASCSAEEFDANVRWADIVFLHAGVGSALNVLDSGKVPVLLVRSPDHNEHVDDHQCQIALALKERGLAEILDLDDPDIKIVQSAHQALVERIPGDPFNT